MKTNFKMSNISFNRPEFSRNIVEEGIVVEVRHYPAQSFSLENAEISIEYSVEELGLLVGQNKELVPLFLDFVRKMKS